jgi:hypothetical protein
VAVAAVFPWFFRNWRRTTFGKNLLSSANSRCMKISFDVSYDITAMVVSKLALRQRIWRNGSHKNVSVIMWWERVQCDVQPTLLLRLGVVR